MIYPSDHSGDAKVTINFTKTNELSGNSDVNRFWEVYNSYLNILLMVRDYNILIVSTMMFCQDR